MYLISFYLLGTLAYSRGAIGSYVELLNGELSMRNVPGGTCFTKTHPSKSTVCGKPGGYDIGKGRLDPISDAQTASLKECRDYCFTVNGPKNEASAAPPSCESFTYDTSTKPGTCKLYANELNNTSFASIPGSSVKLYSKNCFYCDRKCPFPNSEENLLSNPDFDKSDSLLGPWLSSKGTNTSSIKIIPGGGMSGSNAVSLSGLSELIQEVGLCQDQPYIWSIRYKLVPQNGSADCSRVPGNIYMGGGYFTLAPALGTNVWLTGAVSVFGGPGIDEIHLVAPYITSCPVLVDYISVKAIDPPQTLEITGGSLIENGGFETGHLEPWSIATYRALKYTSKVVKGGLGNSSGSYRYQFHCSDAKFNPDYSIKDARFELRQTTSTATKINQNYVLTFDYLLKPDADYLYAHIDGKRIIFYNGLFGFTPNKVVTFSRVFSGTGKPVKLSISTKRSKSVLTPRDPYSQTAEFDNIAIYELAKR